MVVAVVFASAVAEGLVPVVGAAPYEVLARQLPRTLVARLNGSGDRGVRFFPFLGPIDGQRSFLRPSEPFEPGVLCQLHRQGDVGLLCDGVVQADGWRWRLIDGRTGAVRRELLLPFDARQPFEVLARLEFELTDALAWHERPQPLVPLRGEAMGWFLVLKDELLRREARLPPHGGDPLRAARKCVETAAQCSDVVDLVGDFVAHLLRAEELRAECAELLVALAAAVGDDVARLERLDALLLAAGEDATAASVAVRAALLRPEREDLVERAAAQSFKLQRYDDVRTVVDAARRRGLASAAALAQLAAACDRTEDHATRAAVVQELVGHADLPIPVARLVVSFLLEEEQPAIARAIVERALRRAPDHAMLHFELGRACLLLADAAAAAAALGRARQLGLAPAIDGQARRLQRLSAVPGLWAATQRIEHALAADDLTGAFAAARALVRRVGPVAEAWYLLGVVCHKRGMLRHAERLLQRALRADPDCADAHNRLGILLVANGRVDAGRVHLERAHVLAPTDPSPLLHLAQACALAGEFAAADAHVAAAERIGAEPGIVQAVRAEIGAGRS